jgi:hypothetical protein
MAEVVLQSERLMEATRARASTTIAKMKAEYSSSIQAVYAKVKNEEIQRQNCVYAALQKIQADVMLIKERLAANELLSRPPKLQEEEAAQDSRPRRIIRPNKRFCSDEWGR